MADREWRPSRDRERYEYDQRYGDREFRDRQWGPRRDYGHSRDWDEDRHSRGDWWDRNVPTRDYQDRGPRDDRSRLDWESQRWRSSRDRANMIPQFESDSGERFDREFENRGAAQRDWTDRRIGNDPDRGYRNTDYGGSWGQQATAGMRGNYSGGLVQGTGRYAGRGPKNWQRNDDRVREDVNEALTQHPDVDASEVDVQVSGGEVTLTGTVSSRHEKRAAEDCAWNVSGVRDVANHLKVQQGVMDRITSTFSGDERK
jgi:hypothetical protein